jgi:AAHS family 4-hydroxybenzoate transporter-like MFS transporter
LAALSVVLDGFDSQLIGFAVPVLIKEWGITRAAFAPALAAGLVGMSIGSACAGILADRFGRRSSIIGSVFLFGIATCAVGFSRDLLMIGILRFITGLGIGGALPGATTMMAEFTPARRRTMAITATIVCVPLGGMFAGLFAGQIVPAFGWRVLFQAGGLLPVVLGVVLLFALPESPRFLALHPARWPELTALLGRMGRPVATGTAFTDTPRQGTDMYRGFPVLFRQNRARDTAAIWAAFFLCLFAVYSAFYWLPAVLVAEGLSVAVAGSGLTAYNLGGVIGALLLAWGISRFGSRWPLLLCCAGAAASALFLKGVDINHSTGLLIFGFGVHGMFVNAVQSTMFAVCAFLYPTMARATGTASALAFGRLGAIISSFAGATAIAMGGLSGYASMLAMAMAGVFLALALLRHHIPPPHDRQNHQSAQ